MVTSNVDAGDHGHVGKHARFVSHDVFYFIFNVSTRASPCPSPPCFLLTLYVRWPSPKHPVALSDVGVCPQTFALKFPITIIIV